MTELPEGQEWVFEMVNNILIEVLGTIAEQERQTIRQRQAEGIEAAKAKGKNWGVLHLLFPKIGRKFIPLGKQERLPQRQPWNRQTPKEPAFTS